MNMQAAARSSQRRLRCTELRRAIQAARRAILELRQSETIGDDAFHQLEEELDRAELGANG